MNKKSRQNIEEIVGQMQCAKDFECIKNGFERLCKAKDIGLDGYLECLENDPSQCEFALHFGHMYLCLCSLRVFIEKKNQEIKKKKKKMPDQRLGR